MVSYLQRDNLPNLAYVAYQGTRDDLPVLVFCGGYRSDMGGTKAVFLEEQCRACGQSFVRFDYSGHGQSEGEFEACVISDWLRDACDVLDALVADDFVLVGSSMGGWISLLVALRYQGRARLKGLVGIAAAPDFTEDMFHQRLSAAQQRELMEEGIVYVSNDYSDEPYSFTRAFYEDGQRNLVLSEGGALPCPVKFLQGRADKDVPWETAVRIQNAFGLADDCLVFIEGGDHRLSAPDQLDLLWDLVTLIV